MLRVICKNDKLQWNNKLLPLDIDKEYEVENEFEVTVCWNTVKMYEIDGKPFRAERFEVLDE